MSSGIYLIKHIISGRLYVGSALSIPRRILEHRRDLRAGRHVNRRLQNAWNKYGPDAFDFSVLEAVDDPTRLIQCEQRWIDALKAAIKPNFNISPTAGSLLGVKLSVATRAKMSAAHMGRKQSPESIAKVVAVHLGAKRSPEARARISAAQRRRPMHPNTRAAIALAIKGRTFSAKTRAKMSASSLGKPKSAEHSANISRAMMGNTRTKGHVLSEEHKAKVAAAALIRESRKRAARLQAQALPALSVDQEMP